MSTFGVVPSRVPYRKSFFGRSDRARATHARWGEKFGEKKCAGFRVISTGKLNCGGVRRNYGGVKILFGGHGRVLSEERKDKRGLVVMGWARPGGGSGLGVWVGGWVF